MTGTHPQNRRFCYARASTYGQALDTQLKQRSTKTLSNHRPRPSILIRTPAASSLSVNAALVNCAPCPRYPGADSTLTVGPIFGVRF